MRKCWYPALYSFSQNVFSPVIDKFQVVICKCFQILQVQTLPSDKIVNWSKLKAFAGYKINVNEKLKFGLGKVENIVGKREKCCSAFFHFRSMFLKDSFLKVVKSHDCVVRS